MKVLILIFLATVIVPAQQHYIQLIFSEPMQMETILNKDNYTLFNQSMQQIPIVNVGAINDSIAVLIVPPLAYKTNYLVRVDNVRDKAGNYINDKNIAWFRFDGFDQNVNKTGIKIRRK